MKKTYFIKISSSFVNWVLITVLLSCSSSIEKPSIQESKEVKEPSQKQLSKEKLSKEKPSIDKWSGNKEDLKNRFQKIENKPNRNAVDLLQAGLYAYLLGAEIKSEKYYQEILTKKNISAKNKAKALINLSLIDVHRKKYNLAKANLSRVANLEKVLQKEDPQFYSTLINKRDFVQAFILFKEGAPLLAVQKIESILEENNNDLMIYSFLSYIYLEMGSIDLAKKVVSRGLKINTQHDGLNFIKARILFQKNPQSAEGKEILEKLAKKSSYQVLALNYLGELSLQTDNFLEAEAYLNKAVDIDPMFIASFNNLAIAQKGLKKYVKAKEIWLSILENYGDVKEVHFNLASLYRSYLNDPQKTMEHEAIFQRLMNKNLNNK